uniref:Uncharacterized protein n=1 Tax=Meloidogyne javanica TaxID=6303 RepID=A0A915LFJ6_MELJA
MNENRQGEEPSERKMKRLKRINEEIEEFRRDEEFYKEKCRKTKEKYEKACQNLNKTRNAIEDLEKIAKQITGHDGKDNDLQQHDNQIVEYTNSEVETNKNAAILFVGHLTGYLGYLGYVYCSSPEFIYFAGAFVSFCWYTESTIELILAMNRCIELLSSEMARKIFKGCYIRL